MAFSLPHLDEVELMTATAWRWKKNHLNSQFHSCFLKVSMSSFLASLPLLSTLLPFSLNHALLNFLKSNVIPLIQYLHLVCLHLVYITFLRYFSKVFFIISTSKQPIRTQFFFVKSSVRLGFLIKYILALQLNLGPTNSYKKYT